MRVLWVLPLVVLLGCDKAKESAAEKALDVATGGKVKKDGDKITITGDDGKATVEMKGGKTVVTGKDSERATMTVEGETGTAKSKEGTITFGKGEVPEGFPLPVYTGAEVRHARHAKPVGKNETYQLMAQVADPVEKVAAFYEQVLQDKGLKPKRAQMKNDKARHVSLKAESDRTRVIVSVVQQKDDKHADLMIVWSNRPQGG